MQLKSIKTAKEAPFAGVEFVKTDKNITEVIIGGKLRIRASGTYSADLSIFVEQPYEEAKRHRVTASIDGFDPKISYHDDSYSAGQVARDFEAKGATVEISEVTVFLNDNGDVVEVATTGTSSSPVSDDLPF